MDSIKDNVDSKVSVKNLESILSDVENALSSVRKTMVELDRALNGVEQKLNSVNIALGGKGPITNQTHILPHLQCLYDPVEQAAIETALAEAEEQGHQQPCNPEIDRAALGDDPDTGDTLKWYHGQRYKDLGEVVSFAL
jgi:hypothetical protein